ncbi:MAG TPA: serine O-acetyltransferase EpsC [Fimbriimonadaceae bacterium]|nr:serine O-acetyltransferase EpsC [Fimbriimonadaceae bacterium]
MNTSDDRYTPLIERITAKATAGFPPQTRSEAVAIGEHVLSLLFPHLASTSTRRDKASLAVQADRLCVALTSFQALIQPLYPFESEGLVDRFIERLPDVYSLLLTDAEAMYSGDPAAESLDEVMLAYPGFRAIATYRVAHELCAAGMPILPRLLTEWAHTLTGVDIHPGAFIGRSFAIDHATGVVIGETSIIGNGVRLYQGVTLGAHAVSRDLIGAKRHPTVEDNVVIYAHATILGGTTVIGHDSIIGGNAWITGSVPPFSTVNRQSEVSTRKSRRGGDAAEFHI